jgi:glycine/D-amino acid oxidase-like deaminating enzyme
MLRQAGKAVADTVIIGGGVMGSSVAYHLSKLRGSGRGIVVLERDPSVRLPRACAVLARSEGDDAC